MTSLDQLLLDALDGQELERVCAGAYLVTLRGRRRPTTQVWFIGGEHDVTVEAFVMHVLEGADAACLHLHLLRANLSLKTVHFCVDEVGDVFLTGRLTSVETIDHVLGEVWQLLESHQDRLLAAAYGSDVPSKALLDGAGRRPAGTSPKQAHRDARR